MFAKETFALHGAARRKMIVAFLLMLEAVVFFVLYSQMPTSLNFFAIHNVEHSISRRRLRAGAYQALNPFWIMLSAQFWPRCITKWAIACRCRTSSLSA